MPEIIYGEQGDDSWKAHRCGSIGGSSIKRLMSKGQGKTRTTLLYELAAETLTGTKHEGYTSQAMIDGLVKEEEALREFSFITGLGLERVSLIKGNIPHTHCSPDSLIPSKNSGVEVKAPLAHTQVRYINENKMPTDYVKQVQFSMWITGYDYWWFFSYHPKLNPFLLKVERDEKLIKTIKNETIKFLAELKILLKKMGQNDRRRKIDNKN